MNAGTPMVNLIPGRRLRARRSVRRARLWVWAIPVIAGVLVGVFIVNRVSWDTDTEPLVAALAETEKKINETETRVRRQRVELREAEAVLRANRAVGEQPDWSLLLSLLSSKLGTEAALTECALQPVAAAAPGKGAAEADKGGVRPRELSLVLKGVSRTQAAVSRFVLDLEMTGAFDKVALVETKRGRTEEEGISFEVVCDLTDSGANTR